jgi:hypothetical protein
MKAAWRQRRFEKATRRGARIVLRDSDRLLSLEDIDGEHWDGAKDFPSYVVTTCDTVHRTPLNELTPEEVRLAIGQPCFESYLPYLMPLAIGFLEPDPAVDVTFYAGDLLKYVLRISPTYWTVYPEQTRQVMALVERFLDSETWREARSSRFRREMQAAIDNFTALHARSVEGGDVANMQTDRRYG